MKQRILKFSVCDQRITTEDISVVADSKNYLAALFSFDSTWDGTEKTAVFSQGEKVYNMLLEGDMCRIPAEVITEGAFYVSVFGGDLITADKIRIEVVPSGLMEGIVPPVPTEDIYNQLVERVASEAADAAASAELAVLSSQMSQDFASEAELHSNTAYSHSNMAIASEASARESKITAEKAANTAQSAASAAQAAENTVQAALGVAESAATRAEQAAASIPQMQERFADVTTEQNETSLWLDSTTRIKADKNSYICVSGSEILLVSPHVAINNGELIGNLIAYSNKILELGDPTSPTDAANKKYVDDQMDKTEWKMLSKGTLDDATGGVGQIKTEIFEDMTNMTEFKLYLEFPSNEAMAGQTVYLNAHISGDPITLNTFYSVMSDKLISGQIYKSASFAKVVNGRDEKMIMGVIPKPNYHSGINSRGTPYSCQSPWILPSGTQHLYINTTQTFESGTKWFLEGR